MSARLGASCGGRVRLILEFIDQQTQSQQDANAIVRVAFKCCKCCMWCFEKSIKFLSAYAYVYVIMDNKAFCFSCKKTFDLISSHTTQLAINSAVKFMLAILQTVSIPLASTLAAYYSFITPDNATHVVLTRNSAGTSPYVVALVPSFAVLVLSFIFARSFTSVYEQVVTALTVCVLHDKDVLHRDVLHMRPDIRDAFEIKKQVRVYYDDGVRP